MNKPVKLFIVEGEDRDLRFVTEMAHCFFSHGRYETRVLSLSAQQNIYMLYQILKQDSFESDIVEVLRENVDNARTTLANVSRQEIDEIYLFFDYDIHQDNIRHISDSETPESVIRTLLRTFDNETENGKLYISYPMVEALYDCYDSMCQAFSACYVDIDSMSAYKTRSGDNNPIASSHMDILAWKNALNVFTLRVGCLFERPSLSFSEYR